MRSKLNIISLISIFFVAYTIQLSLVYRNIQVASLFNNIIIIVMFILCISLLKKISLNDLFLILIILFFTVCNVLFRLYAYNSVDIRNVSFIFVTMLLLVFVKHVEIPYKYIKYNKYILFLITVIYFFNSYNKSNIGFYPENYLMYGYSNPNVLSFTLLINNIYIYISTKGFKEKLLSIIFILLNYNLIIQTGSRNAIIASTILIIFFILDTYMVKKMYSILYYVSICLPLLVVFFNQSLNSIIHVFNNKFNNGKVGSLNSRDTIWMNSIEETFSGLTNTFIGTQDMSTIFSRNPHNYLLFILLKNGVLIFILYLYTLTRAIFFKLNNFSRSKVNLKSSVSWFLIVLLNSFESHLSYGYIFATVLSILLLGDLVDE